MFLEEAPKLSAEWTAAGATVIAAFATVVIAVFTFTLWRSTHQLWKAGEKQFAATHRPRLRVRYIKIAIHGSTFIQYRVVNVGASIAKVRRNTISVLRNKSNRTPFQRIALNLQAERKEL
jgi:lysylphosphatidylglycerol synthetase-like protein (DUF2156 family)